MSVPEPYTVVKRIPDDLPFVARPGKTKRALFLGGFVLVMLLFIGCLLGLGLVGEERDDVGTLIAGFGMIVALLVVPFALQYWLLTSGGPVLAVGPDGIWIKTRPTRGQAVWLPWAAIERIYRRRWGFEKLLCVKAYAGHIGGSMGAFTAIDSGVSQAVFGTGLTAPLAFADRSEQDILQAVAYYAAGRVALA